MSNTTITLNFTFEKGRHQHLASIQNAHHLLLVKTHNEEVGSERGLGLFGRRTTNKQENTKEQAARAPRTATGLTYGKASASH